MSQHTTGKAKESTITFSELVAGNNLTSYVLHSHSHLDEYLTGSQSDALTISRSVSGGAYNTLGPAFGSYTFPEGTIDGGPEEGSYTFPEGTVDSGAEVPVGAALTSAFEYPYEADPGERLCSLREVDSYATEGLGEAEESAMIGSSMFEYPVSSAQQLAVEIGLVPAMSSTMPMPPSSIGAEVGASDQKFLHSTNGADE